MKKPLVLVIVLAALLLVATPTLAQGQPKKDVCHWDGSRFIRITLADPAWDAHSAHGDKEVGVDVDENCQPLSAPIAVCLADNNGWYWDLTLETATGQLTGDAGWGFSWGPWGASGSVDPPDLFGTTASSTLGLRVDNPEPTDCYPYADYFVVQGTRVSGNTFSGVWTNWCFSGDTAGSGDWEGTFYEGTCSTVASASTLSSGPGGPTPLATQ